MQDGVVTTFHVDIEVLLRCFMGKTLMKGGKKVKQKKRNEEPVRLT